MAKHSSGKSANTALARARKKGLVCSPSHPSLVLRNPRTGKKYRRPMCASSTGKIQPTHKAATKARAVASDCSKGFEIGMANPVTGKRFKRPTCVLVTQKGRVRTKRPYVGKKSRANAVKVSRTVALSGRRRR